MKAGDKYILSEFTGMVAPITGIVLVIYDGYAYAYMDPEPTTISRYRFCVSISNDFGADFDFVPTWKATRVFHADNWPCGNLTDEHNDQMFGDPDVNWNAES